MTAACPKTPCALLLVVAVLWGGSLACPKPCVCKWKNGKQTVECNRKDLPDLPAGMDGGTQVLEFVDNDLRSLANEKFLKMELTNLQRIYLSRCKISNIDGRAFNGLTNLVELDLSENSLVSVPSDIFRDCAALMKLTLNSNPIGRLEKGAFDHLSYLSTLELSNCEVEFVDENAFQGLHSLEWLNLEGNKLATIKGIATLPRSLKGVELQNNPWSCDCRIVDLHAWLLDFNMPQPIAPKCSSPTRLSGRSIRSIPSPELACLPDVSPTTFYLEIAEGRNVSLLCHVKASPEAKVSWWYEGRVLQNDTLVAPGVHLTYFIEHGTEEKKSELFIFNTNTEDNGTFICNAENAAGASLSNFTIRIIVREEPVVVDVTFPLMEYLPFVIAAAVVCNAIVIIALVALIVKCRKRRSRLRKREKTKEVALQYQQNVAAVSGTFKGSVLFRDTMPTEPLSNSMLFKEEVNHVSGSCTTDLGSETCTIPEERIGTNSPPAGTLNHVSSPSSLCHYQLERNPDLINDAENGGRRREGGDGEAKRDEENPERERRLNPQPLTHRYSVPAPGCLIRVPPPGSDAREFYANSSCSDVRLNPGCLLDAEGYPVDYGLPKMYPARQPQPPPPSMTGKYNGNFYRTLPYNRGNKKGSAGNPAGRFSREAEFLSRNGAIPARPAAYEHYCPGVRYTADGYPARDVVSCEGVFEQANVRATYVGEEATAPTSLPCCVPPGTPLQWPQCVPANLHTLKKDVARRCVGAQTDEDEDLAVPGCGERPNPDEPVKDRAQTKNDSDAQDTQSDPLNEVLTESPDEGYEGEPALV